LTVITVYVTLIYVADLLAPFRNAALSLGELIVAAERFARRAKVTANDGRVAAALDERVVRYYQTIGLLQKPDRYDGRRAVYSYRHVLQLVYIRALQAEGYPLALIQENLLGRSTGQLEESVRKLLTLPAPQRLPPPAPRELVAAELAPGISVLIDSSQVAAPQDVVERLRAALRTLHKE
jgi:DNA-binding transcriptional MerR regulator